MNVAVQIFQPVTGSKNPEQNQVNFSHVISLFLFATYIMSGADAKVKNEMGLECTPGVTASGSVSRAPRREQ